MTRRVDADIDALVGLRSAVLRFREQQRQVLSSAAREVETTRAALERKAERWSRELAQRRRELDRCRSDAAAAAERGGWVDCTSLAWAVTEAEERLENVRSWQRRVEQEVAAHAGDRRRFDECVEIDVPKAGVHLNNLILALRRARDTRIGGTS
jgi:alanyl-tRNA synthetase